MRARLLSTISAAILLLIAASPVFSETGIASEYGPGNGVAMHFCTWTLRHTQGCGSVEITSLTTHKSTIAPVVDYCYCLVPDSPHPYRLIDLEYGVVEALGLSTADGLYQVDVERISAPQTLLPNTAFSSKT